jgi:hypothetical protein
MNDAPGEMELRFPCICGKELVIPAEVAGSDMECPWCTRLVIAPVRNGSMASPAPEPPPMEEIEFARCPECAGACAGTACLLCGRDAVPAGDRRLLLPCGDQGVVPPPMADWILRKYAWLIRQRGMGEILGRRIVLPTDEFFPGVWEPTREDLEDLLRRVQGFAGLEGLHLRLLLHPGDAPDASIPVALGWKSPGESTVCTHFPRRSGDQYSVVIGEGLFADRAGLVATLAHAVGHLYILERLKLREKLPPDHELLADLVTVFLGLGVLTCEGSIWIGTGARGGIARQGFLSQAGFSLALALDAALRAADSREILPHLGLNAHEYVSRSARFLADHPDLVEKIRLGKAED